MYDTFFISFFAINAVVMSLKTHWDIYNFSFTRLFKNAFYGQILYDLKILTFQYYKALSSP